MKQEFVQIMPFNMFKKTGFLARLLSMKTKPLEDCYLVSYPKSGRTWLRIMLDSLGVSVPVSHDGSDYKNPVHYNQLTPCGDTFSGKRVIFLVRDPRDVVVSYYFELTRRQKVYSGPIGEFIKDPRYGLERIIHFNVSWFNQSECKAMLLLTYEQMHQAPERTLAAAASFSVGKKSAERVRDAIAKCSFEAMRKQEISGEASRKFGKAMLPGDISDPESYKVRKGKIGGYTEYLSEDEVLWCSQVIDRTGYEASLSQALARYGI